MVYKEKPENFNPRMEVVSCFVESEGKVLFLHRNKNKPQGNTWDRPSGKVNKNETLIKALTREVKEETNLDITQSELIYSATVYVKYPEFDFIYHMFSIQLVKPEIKLNPAEHNNYSWFTPEEALLIELIPGEAECIRLHYKL